jgi:hypothetical protein
MFTAIRSAAVMLALGTAVPASAEFDAHAFHDSNCMACHGTEVYTRSDRRIRSYPSLEAQVARCDANLGTKLFPEDLQALTDYLNTKYYKFAE